VIESCGAVNGLRDSRHLGLLPFKQSMMLPPAQLTIMIPGIGVLYASSDEEAWHISKNDPGGVHPFLTLNVGIP